VEYPLNFKTYLLLMPLLFGGCGLKGSPKAPSESFIPALEKSYADQMNSAPEKTENKSNEASDQ
jgi:hypothetical protein